MGLLTASPSLISSLSSNDDSVIVPLMNSLLPLAGLCLLQTPSLTSAATSAVSLPPRAPLHGTRTRCFHERGLSVRGGGKTSTTARPTTSNIAAKTQKKAHKKTHNTVQHSRQQSTSVLLMAFAMSLHFFGYEFARSATLTLFTSSLTGFSSNAALPLVLACVCPASLALLQFYTAALDARG
eukprot:CAMPEP_0197558296 /NCGR_PEP_ID=MMETSP1320-20131121/18916_1 /TAXON_ID=91990 /ORGANISM="Bolidomonas sp., Strain RCC2347" /LENGTH=181 /DNA_ID=CAMNT_0043119593 /DNA_START=59 /DNA_END=601 /DNA_ORIENTATION=-